MPDGCFVPNCKSGYRYRKNEKDLKKISVFSAPKDEKLLKLWGQKIPRKDRKIRSSDFVCERHFLEDDILRFYETKLPDGSIDRQPRGRVSLKSGAIPVLFPNCPSYLSKPTRKRKPPKDRKERKTLPQKKRKLIREPEDPPVVNIIDESIEGSTGTIESLPLPTFNSNFAENVVLSAPWVRVNISDGSILFIYVSNGRLDKHVLVKDKFETEFYVNNVRVQMKQFEGGISDEVTLLKALDEMAKVNACSTINNSNLGTMRCYGFAMFNENQCKMCLSKSNKYKAVYERKKSRKKVWVNVTRRGNRMKNKISRLKEVEMRQRQCARTNSLKLDVEIARLPKPQQENIRACLTASKKFKGQGNRYTTEWVYHCLLLKIRSTAAYKHLQRNKIMALPSLSTLHRYLRKLKPVYGFQPYIFDAMKKKGEQMLPEEKRGSIVIDEMKITPNLRFDKAQMRIIGFTDLGEYTPLEQQNVEGDHALVVLYQPFRGAWVQPVGAFLSRGAASSRVLNHIMIEAITLLENAGFCVDAIVTDGANWNRGVWTLHGVNPNSVSCTHVYDNSRKLYFISDYPHLIKCFRNWILKQQVFWTPDGVVYLRHWQSIIDLQKQDGIHYCPKLTQGHIEPKQYQKMKVSLAYQFFGIEIPATLKCMYQYEEPDIDIQATCTFILRINGLIKAMSSRSSKGALRIKSQEYEIITNFISYLRGWKEESKLKNYEFMTESTYKGLMVTLQSTIEIFHFLNTSWKYTYFMTVRLNQDCLEHFFGLVRQSGGHNEHPNPVIFIYIFRLLSVYSLTKPPKGSNVEGDAEVFKNLLDWTETGWSNDECKHHFRFIIDRIVDQGDTLENLNVTVDTNEAMQGFAGYVARQSEKFTNCLECRRCLLGSKEEQCLYLRERDQYNALHTPNTSLWALLQILENYVLEETREEVSCNSFSNILYKLQDEAEIVLVGCTNEEHRDNLTSQIVRYYLVTRMHFLCTHLNRIRKDADATKALRKTSKLK